MNSDLAATYAALISPTRASRSPYVFRNTSTKMHAWQSCDRQQAAAAAAAAAGKQRNKTGRSSKAQMDIRNSIDGTRASEADWKGADKGSLVAFGLGRMASHCGSKHASPRVAPAKHQHSTSALPVASGTLRYDADRSNTATIYIDVTPVVTRPSSTQHRMVMPRPTRQHAALVLCVDASSRSDPRPSAHRKITMIVVHLAALIWQAEADAWMRLRHCSI